MTTPFEHLSTDFWATADRYIGTKEIDAIPMTRGEYSDIRGWQVPKGANPFDSGYIVKYKDGHVSWSPEMVFDECYAQNGKLNFGHALHFLKNGSKVARAGWNGLGMWIILVPAANPTIAADSVYGRNLGEYAGPNGNVDQVSVGAHIDMFTAQGIMQPGWLASQPDMLSNDWTIV